MGSGRPPAARRHERTVAGLTPNCRATERTDDPVASAASAAAFISALCPPAIHRPARQPSTSSSLRVYQTLCNRVEKQCKAYLSREY